MLAISACGDDTATPGQTTLPRVGAPNYATMAPVPATTSTTTLAPGETLPPDLPGSRSTQTMTYAVRPNDGLGLIADRYDITITALCQENGWDDCLRTVITPGQEIRIPVGAMVPGSGDAVETLPPEFLADAPTPDDNSCPDGSARETYQVTANDTSQFVVAQRLGVDLELLSWVNRSNPAWNSFVPGQELFVPCADEELPELTVLTIAPDDTTI